MLDNKLVLLAAICGYNVTCIDLLQAKLTGSDLSEPLYVSFQYKLKKTRLKLVVNYKFVGFTVFAARKWLTVVINVGHDAGSFTSK